MITGKAKICEARRRLPLKRPEITEIVFVGSFFFSFLFVSSLSFFFFLEGRELVGCFSPYLTGRYARCRWKKSSLMSTGSRSHGKLFSDRNLISMNN